MAFIFWIISIFVPPTIRGISLPGLEVKADFFVLVVTMIITAIFLIRALADSLVLVDIVTEVFVRRLGIKEENPSKRAGRELIYIIVIILIMTAVSPIFTTLKDGGPMLATAITYIALALIVILIYDIGRVLYRIIEQKADVLADRLARMAEKKGDD